MGAHSKIIKSTIAVAFFLGFVSQVNAQQDAIYSQYMFNPFAINPAYAGSRDAMSAVVLSRFQWAGMDGAPQTNSLAIHGPIKGKNFALGYNMFVETIGPSSNMGAFGTYAYHAPLRKGKLSLGLRAGIYRSVLNRDLLQYEDPNDKFNQQGNVSGITPSFDFGVYYYTNKFFIGAVSTHLGGSSIQFDLTDTIETTFDLDQHFMLASGYAFEFSRDVVFKPSFLVRYVQNAPVNFDVNASFLFNRVFWLGLSYRSSGSLSIITEYNITDFMRIGYSYDIILSRLRRFNSGSHELFIGFDFNLKSRKVLSPRYL